MVPSALRSITASGAPSRTARKRGALAGSAWRERPGMRLPAIVVMDNDTAARRSASSLLRLRRALLEKIAHPRLGLRIGLRHRGHQRFHGVAGGRVVLGD